MEVSAILNVLFYDRQKRDDFLFESCIYCLFKYQIFLDGLMQLLQMSCRMFAFLILEFELHIYLFLFKNIYIILSNISSLLSLFCLVFMVYVNYNSIMKKARSPNKNALASLLQPTERQMKYQQTKQFKPFPSILSKTHDQQHRRNANSIKVVLKELQDMKKDLKDLKHSKKMENLPEELDNSKCRKLKAETKRSSPSPEGLHSHSNSKHKPSSSQKEISTQTKRMNKREPNQFSFTGQQPDMRIPQQFAQSQDEDSVEYNPFSLRTHQHSQKKLKNGKSHSQSRSEIHKIKVNQQLQSIQAGQLYEKYLNSLKNSFSMLQISSTAFTSEDKVRLNIQLQRMSGQIRRIPMHIRQPIEHYENVTIYARNLNNQLNNLAVLLNRCEGRQPRLKQRSYGENMQVNSCKNCEENQKKDVQRYHKREMKRIQKEILKLQGELEHSRHEINVLTTQNLILIKQKDDFNAKLASLQRRLGEQEKKVRLLQDVKGEMERQVRDAEGRRLKQVQKNQLQEEDLNYYKAQLDKIKKNGYNLRDMERKEQQTNILISQLKEKQLLYQSIIRDKENQIVDLRQKVSDLFEELNIQLSQHRTSKRQAGQGQSDVYKLRSELDDKNRELTNSSRQIQLWKMRTSKHEARNNQLQSILEQCTAQIKRLHLEINCLEESSQNYKEKYLKTRSKNQPKPKRQAQKPSRKQSAFEQLNELIKNHKKNIQNEAWHK